MGIVRALKRARGNVSRGFYWGFGGYLSFAGWAIRTRGGSRLPNYDPSNCRPDLVAGLAYSREALRHYRPNQRATRLLTLLTMCSTPDRGRLLIIGPRYENEIYVARALGWRSKEIAAVDLLSYSPRIQIGDMHSLPFSDASFAAVSCGWTLSYSQEPATAARELARIVEVGGVLGLGVEVVDELFHALEIEGILHGTERVQRTDQVQALFPDFSVVVESPPAAVPGDFLWILRRDN